MSESIADREWRAAARRRSAPKVLMDVNDAMAREGLRVLALASGPVAEAPESAVRRADVRWLGRLCRSASGRCEGRDRAAARCRSSHGDADRRSARNRRSHRPRAESADRRAGHHRRSRAGCLVGQRADAKGCRRLRRSAESRPSTSCGSFRRFRREATSSRCWATA